MSFFLELKSLGGSFGGLESLIGSLLYIPLLLLLAFPGTLYGSSSNGMGSLGLLYIFLSAEYLGAKI